MSFLDIVKKRRSVRGYLPDPIPRESLERCLEAARLAPSACNSQPWSFIVVDNAELKNKLAEKAFSGVYSMNKFAKGAPALVAVVTEKSTYAAKLGGYFRGTQYNLIDIGIACGHFALQAEEEGLGTCLLGWFDEKGVKKVLGIPGNKKVDIIISVGYPFDREVREKNRKPLSDIARWI